ncbi:hypothetical protein WN943_006037 [Citrus x changshan-huyou]
MYERKVAVINLDPANDSLPYPLSLNFLTNAVDLIRLSDVMMEHSLGPNGGLVYCMDYLEKNIDWLQPKLEPLLKDHYLLFDFPGQVELFFLHSNAKTVIMRLIKKLNLRLTAVHLVDVHLCSDPGNLKYQILSQAPICHISSPINYFGYVAAFNLEYYTDVQDLSYLQQALGQDPHSAKHRSQMVNFLSNSSLLHSCFDDICGAASYLKPAYVQSSFCSDKESVAKLVKPIDKSNGYIFAGMDASAVEFSKIAVRDVDWDYFGYPSFHLFSILLFSYS